MAYSDKGGDKSTEDRVPGAQAMPPTVACWTETHMDILQCGFHSWHLASTLQPPWGWTEDTM